ncbi:MAG TPA: prepilin-type N-terminal cleavage/methylation domain-containing protein [Phycisphaerae bacterium]|nr:prepilin-type N-terminal cleavage/methylation domain-containing protein [Phycisphaerae bacterium]
MYARTDCLTGTWRRFRMSRRTPACKGFTLIEVLVVVAIIALLISILLPSLRQARDLAKRVMCNTNLHDLGICLNTYAHENNAFFPPTPYLGSTPSSNPNEPWGPGDDNLFILWYRKYARNIASFSCPATTYRVRTPEKIVKQPALNGFTVEITTNGIVGQNDFEHLAQKVSSNGFGTSYEYNGWYTRGSKLPVINWYFARPPDWTPDHPLWQGNKPLTLNVLKPAPSRTFIMHDADESGNVMGAPGTLGTDSNNYPESWDNHGDKGMNILFVDAHAEFFIRSRVGSVWEWKKMVQ